jgi:hypothetical protein
MKEEGFDDDDVKKQQAFKLKEHVDDQYENQVH